VANENVIIEASWNMFLDVDPKKLPVFQTIEIRGRLTLKEGMDHHL